MIQIDFINEEQFKNMLSWYEYLKANGLTSEEDDDLYDLLCYEWRKLIGV